MEWELIEKPTSKRDSEVRNMGYSNVRRGRGDWQGEIGGLMPELIVNCSS
jgi:hypothetical protein